MKHPLSLLALSCIQNTLKERSINLLQKMFRLKQFKTFSLNTLWCDTKTLTFMRLHKNKIYYALLNGNLLPFNAIFTRRSHKFIFPLQWTTIKWKINDYYNCSIIKLINQTLLRFNFIIKLLQYYEISTKMRWLIVCY